MSVYIVSPASLSSVLNGLYISPEIDYEENVITKSTWTGSSPAAASIALVYVDFRWKAGS